MDAYCLPIPVPQHAQHLRLAQRGSCMDWLESPDQQRRRLQCRYQQLLVQSQCETCCPCCQLSSPGCQGHARLSERLQHHLKHYAFKKDLATSMKLLNFSVLSQVVNSKKIIKCSTFLQQ